MKMQRWAMLAGFALACLAACPRLSAASPPASGGVIIDERFDSYVDQFDFESVWQPMPGAFPPFPGPPEPFLGVLLPQGSPLVLPPNDFPPDMDGQAVYIQHRLNVYAGPASSELATLRPTLTESIRLSADFFDDTLPNKRVSVGLRSSITPANIIELGRWNASAFDPTEPPDSPATISSTGFAYRVVQFGPVGGELVRQPNFQYFPLDQALESPLDDDALVRPEDVGPGWHRYSATISVDFVTLTLDLFRDGKNNATGLPGVDSTVTWEISPRMEFPFDSLRIGSPSGLTSSFGAVVDNVRLELVSVPEPATAIPLMIAAIGFAVLSARVRS
jgi:hypothetical protein